jgi:hypothetical protein
MTEMLNLRQHTATFELTLAIIGAFGMIIMMMNPLMGQVLMGGALSLLFVMYLLISIMPRDPEADSRFQVILGRINFLVAAFTGLILLVLLVFVPHNMALALPALVLLAICLALNSAHRYIYGIKDTGYVIQQIRLLLLAGLVVLVVLCGP